MKQVEDYSVGDWVLCKEVGLNKPMRIDCIGKTHISLVSDTGGEISGIPSMVDFVPLPLTEEILRANEFEKQDSKDCLFIIKGKRENIIEVNMTYHTLRIEWNGVSVNIDCDYIHELQRTLRCFKFYGLACNFRID